MLSDASYTATAEDDVQEVARVIIIIAAKFPEGIRQLVRRLTPTIVASSLDSDLLDSDHLRKVKHQFYVVVYDLLCD